MSAPSSDPKSEQLSREDACIEAWLRDTTEAYTDWEWDGETLTVFNDQGDDEHDENPEKHSRKDLIEAGAFDLLGYRQQKP